MLGELLLHPFQSTVVLMIKKIALIFAAMIAVFVVVVAMQPSEFRITRTATVSAPAAAVFAQVNDFHHWGAWSPWAKLDPAMKQTFEGAPAGTGAIYTWAGNSQIGEGRMTVIDSRPNELIKIKLEFLKPFASVASADFAFKTKGDQTSVTWNMEGRNNFFAKAIGLFLNMDKMVGGQFEMGLAQMAAAAETASRQQTGISAIHGR